MPEINPYEAPQSEQLPSAEEQQPNMLWPAWLGKALWVQFAAILITFFAAPIPVSPPHHHTRDTIVVCVIGIIFLFSLFMLVTAIRYRIGWLVALELIVIMLPTYAFLITIFG